MNTTLTLYLTKRGSSVSRSFRSDPWRPPGFLQSKGGSPRKGGSPQEIGNHGRIMAHVFERTKDPFFLVVPRTNMPGFTQLYGHFRLYHAMLELRAKTVNGTYLGGRAKE